MSDVMAIGRYQLENLFRAGVRFTYFDIRDSGTQVLSNELLAGATAVPANEVLSRLQAQSAAPDTAILLICEDGVKSKTVAQQLEEAGFMNVYRVEGGVAAL